jgi:hypothetical protein
MNECATVSSFKERRSEERKEFDRYYSVEFAIQGLEISYQFKIWNVASKSMCVLVKEGSEVLKRLKVGEILNMKFYSADAVSPTDYLETAIRHITKDEQGRFRGHYLVGLEILGHQNPQVH